MSTVIHSDCILIIDFGSQYTQLIARRVREIGVFCEIYPYDVDFTVIEKLQPKAIILSGSPESAHVEGSGRVHDLIFQMNIPILGICYGMQVMAIQLGGEVSCGHKSEFGYAQIQLVGEDSLLAGIEDHVADHGELSLDVWMSHGDQVTKLPPNFKGIAKTNSCPFAAIECKEKNWYGVQFHPETTQTKQGKRILEKFVVQIAGCRCLWTPTNIVNNLITEMRDQVGNKKVLLALSGGVDSSVVAALLHKAIGNQLVCVFVDNGLLRQDEGKQVIAMFAKNMGINVIKVDAQSLFLNRLQGVSDPEVKRKIIGKTFIDVFKDQSIHFENIDFLAQGTIYPDVVESAKTVSGKATVIKSHHNVGGLPDVLPFKLLEPLRECFKDEVRKIGLELGLPYDMVYRHPFPGPGLGVRILGEVKKEYANILRQADAIFIEELHKADWYHKVNQAFAVFMPIKSVGVVGDMRRYGYVIALRAVETVDFMTAHWVKLPYELIEVVSSRIVNEIKAVSRVVYDISSKPPATIEWE